MELIKKLFLFSFQILELLQSNLILPFNFFRSHIVFSYLLLNIFQTFKHFVMLCLLYPQSLDICKGLFVRSNDCIIFLFLIHFFLLFLLIIFPSTCQFIFKLLYDVPICICDIGVVALYFSILLCMFSSKCGNIGIFFFLNFFNLILTPRFHFLSEH